MIPNQVLFCTPQGHLAMSGDCGEGVLTDIEAWDAAKHPAKHRTAPSTEGCLDPNVNSAEVDGPF